MGLLSSIFGKKTQKVEVPATPQQFAPTKKPVKKFLEGEDELVMDWEEGSKKQQAWANEIVKDFVQYSNQLIDDNVSEGAIAQEDAEALKYELNKTIELQDDANWWIDNRDLNIRKKMIEITYADSKEELKKIINRIGY